MAGNPPPTGELTEETLRTIGRTRGVELDLEEAAKALPAVQRARVAMASWVLELRADDDVAAFHAVLRSELPR
ncbi:hypothetical protein [Streptomyces sp. ISID311]|uniref:hypothetical protein n=1 Tax=Streptomyces sp. ISID311 TaxID=2601673 RepID=UPI0011BD3E04|nr:hypothetical protein [Streptomyces sp. ISID311]TXC96214.1 hypothetical protein FS847_19885 [Streptomyces sp. ISID311]